MQSVEFYLWNIVVSMQYLAKLTAETSKGEEIEIERKSIYLISKSVCSLIWLMRLFGLNCLIGLNHFVVCARICEQTRHSASEWVSEQEQNEWMNERANVCRRSVFPRFSERKFAVFLLHLLIYFEHSKNDYKQTISGVDIACIRTFTYSKCCNSLMLQTTTTFC